VFETAIRIAWGEKRRTIFDKCSQITTYADDVVIMRRKLQDAEEVFTSKVEQTNKMRLKINGKMSQFMIPSRKPYNENESDK